MKTVLYTFLVLIATFGCVVTCVGYTSIPPLEATFIDNFRTHRVAFERLRDLLQQDEEVRVVAPWGVATTRSLVADVPPQGDFPLDRYNQYLSLFQESGGIAATRTEEAQPEICVALWRWGWAGDTRHVALCWMHKEPSRQVASLDNLDRARRNSGERHSVVYRRVDGDWWLREDW